MVSENNRMENLCRPSSTYVPHIAFAVSSRLNYLCYWRSL
ncbi:hypothetical protein PAMC26577_35855 [Caballeronia sordidicola]|uniref:Uncharacterized protein n=1 Tax=Caballeronia sordidicola TaxID=196367 RepID=A0A242M9D2_CABSO|nr:hypothetical protein PAMC26577_35855 [Caballeronia sordidicola]